MITLRFGPAALAHVRFAISPLVEVAAQPATARRPRRRARCTCRGWSRRVELTADLDLSLLRALDPTGVYTPDFVSPPPDTPLAELEDELAVVAATPPEQARAEVERSYRRKPPLPAVLEPFVADPAARPGRGRRAAARVLGARAGSALAAPARAARGRRPVSRAPDGRRRRRAPLRRRRPDSQLGRRRAEHRQGQRGAGRRPPRSRPALRPQRLRLAQRDARDRPALAAHPRLSRSRGGDALGDRPPGGAGGARRAARQGARGRADGPRPSALHDRPGARARRLRRRRLPAPGHPARGRARPRPSRRAGRCSTCARPPATGWSARPSRAARPPRSPAAPPCGAARRCSR